MAIDVLPKLRKSYQLAGLRRRDLAADPLDQFRKWFQQALEAGVPEPSAMTLATADPSGCPSARIVLLKGMDERGFLFYTNYQSRKGRELGENPRAALVFFWSELERQIRITGEVSRLSPEESALYFESRPRGSRLGAWASEQGQPVTNREHLIERFREYRRKFLGQPIPMPSYWGGYVLHPVRIEFWQGRVNRLHDRFQYTRSQEGAWEVARLAP